MFDLETEARSQLFLHRPEHQLPHFAFIDAENMRKGFEKSLKDRGISKLDFDDFDLLKLFGMDRFDRKYVYSAVEDETCLPEWLERLASSSRTVLKLGRLTQKSGQVKQEGVDVKLAIDATKLAYSNTMKACTLFGGDGDFVPLVRALSESGCIVQVASFGNPSKGQVAPRLRAEADDYQQISGAVIYKTLKSRPAGVEKRTGLRATISRKAEAIDTINVAGQEVDVLVEDKDAHQEEYLVQLNLASRLGVFSSSDKKSLEYWVKLHVKI